MTTSPSLVSVSLGELAHADVQTLVAALEMVTDALTRRVPQDQAEQTQGAALASVSVGVHRSVERLAAQRLGWLTAIEADGRWALDVMSSFAQWVAWSHGTSLSAARRDLRLARALRDDLPLTAAAVRSGSIGIEHMRVMAEVAATSPARRQALAGPTGIEAPGPPQEGDRGGTEASGEAADDAQADGGPGRSGEAVLVELAARHRVEPFRRVVRHFAAVADPDASDRSFADAQAREFLDVSETLDGYHLAGFLTVEHGQALTTALEAVMGVPAAGDTRSVTQRRAHGLGDLSRIVLDQGLAGGGAAVRPHLTVTVSWSEFEQVTGRDRPPPPFGEPEPEPEPATSAFGGTAVSGAGVPLDGCAPPGSAMSSGGHAPPVGSTSSGGPVVPGGSGLPRGAMSSQNVAPWDDRVSAGEWGVPVGLPVHGVDWDAVLAQSPARWVDGTGPVPPGVLRRLACDSTIGRVVFGPDSQILNVGRRERTVTGARRQAVIARDRRCVWPTCDAPPSRCEVHHAATHWSQGGETSTDNSALLCWYHHDHVDTHGLTMWRLDGRWHITTPDGRTITDRPPATISYGAPGSTPHTAA